MVTNKNNQITYIENSNEQNINVNDGIYNSRTLITEIKKQLPVIDLMFDTNGKVVMLNKSDHIFDILNNDNSVFRQLGFTKLNYTGKKMYIANELPEIDTLHEINFFIEGIDDIKPLITFNSASDLIKKLPVNIKFDNPIKNLNEIFIKFKLGTTYSNKLVNFNGNPHEFKIRIETH